MRLKRVWEEIAFQVEWIKDDLSREVKPVKDWDVAEWNGVIALLVSTGGTVFVICSSFL